jgi:hypothetical protein
MNQINFDGRPTQLNPSHNTFLKPKIFK